jgi:hypothetical protein
MILLKDFEICDDAIIIFIMGFPCEKI